MKPRSCWRTIRRPCLPTAPRPSAHHAPGPARRGRAPGGKIQQLGPLGGEAGPVHRHPVPSEVTQQFDHCGGGPEPIGHGALGGRAHSDGPACGLPLRTDAVTGVARDLPVARDGGGRRRVVGDHDLGPEQAEQGPGPVGHGAGARLEEAEVPQRRHDVYGGAPGRRRHPGPSTVGSAAMGELDLGTGTCGVERMRDQASPLPVAA